MMTNIKTTFCGVFPFFHHSLINNQIPCFCPLPTLNIEQSCASSSSNPSLLPLSGVQWHKRCTHPPVVALCAIEWRLEAKVTRSSCSGLESSLEKLENIEEECPMTWSMVGGAPPETPTETMEFLARSWSLSAMELSKALSDTHVVHDDHKKQLQCPVVSSEMHVVSSPVVTAEPGLFLLHQALNPDFLPNQQLPKNGLYRGILRGKAMGGWLKDQKERKRQETRTHNAQLHAAVSVAGVAAAVAAVTATNAASPEAPGSRQSAALKSSAAIASAAALVASHCIEIAEDMGADHNHISAAVNSAVNARTNGDIMTLTAGAATALRGAATLRARLQRGYEVANFHFAEDLLEENKALSPASKFVSEGRELLKRTRKGALHWKEVSFIITSDFQVVAKMKSKYIKGAFTKKKKCIVSEVYSDIQAWPGREREESSGQKAYFGVKAVDRTIEFECRNKGDKQMWVDGIQHLLHLRDNVT